MSVKITRKQLREFLPADGRFIHFVAKRNGYTFFDQEVVDSATFDFAMKLTKMYNDGMEFENNEHLYGYVMNAARFSILGAYYERNRERKMRIDDKNIEDLLIPSDERNVMDLRMMRDDSFHHYDNVAEVAYERLLASLESPVDKAVVEALCKNQDTNALIATQLDVDARVIGVSKTKIKSRLTRILKDIEDEFKTPEKNRAKASRKVRKQVFYPSAATNKASDISTSKAIAFLHSA